MLLQGYGLDVFALRGQVELELECDADNEITLLRFRPAQARTLARQLLLHATEAEGGVTELGPGHLADGCENRDGWGRFPCPNDSDLLCVLCGARLCHDCHQAEPDCRVHSKAKRAEQAEQAALAGNAICEGE